jgi:hypothetical protein
MADPLRRRTHRLAPPTRLDVATVASVLASELRRRADSPGLEGMVADRLLSLLHRSAHAMSEFGDELERAITPTQAPRARRPPARKPGARASRVRKLHPEE